MNAKRLTPASRRPTRKAALPRSDKSSKPVAKAQRFSGSKSDTAVQAGKAGTEEAIYRNLDRLIHARMGEATAGISTIGLAEAFADWCLHLAIAPAKQVSLLEKGFRKWQRLAAFVAAYALERNGQARCIEPLPQDHRFEGRLWQEPPFNIFYQSFLLTQQWWYNATTTVPGVDNHNERLAEFYSRQLLDMLSPSNFVWTNPELIERTFNEGGRNLVRGYGYLLDDLARMLSDQKPAGTENFRVGETVAATAGSIIFENRLIELIQYMPATEECRGDPILLIPAWIMKYYILDLSPHNSLIRYLVETGHTVFCISWKNPTADDRDLSMDDYREQGIMAAIDAVAAITGSRRVHGAGYCLGGTLLMIAAAAMARDGDDRLASLSLFAGQADFTEAGELSLFVNESQLSLIEDMMWKTGYLDQRQMTGAFQLLRSRDLIWSRVVHEYLMGEHREMSDLMAWNADSTRMPYRMHSEYLRSLFLNNDLAENRLIAGGRPVFLDNIEIPVFAVATERDHVAPWGSVVKLFHLLETEIDFILASGGHNTGIVAPPGESRARYKYLAHPERNRTPGEQLGKMDWKDGSWWVVWKNWLSRHGSGNHPCPPVGNIAAGYREIRAAPGKFVLED